jgi:hypothetical protein
MPQLTLQEHHEGLISFLVMHNFREQCAAAAAAAAAAVAAAAAAHLQ